MSAPVICAAPGCDREVVRYPGRIGRPPIYCSPSCRASYLRPPLSVEVDQDGAGEDERPGRDWTVRLRRGTDTVVVGRGLGRFSATALATELRSLIEGAGQHHSGDER
jgi:hypothetical protein